MVIEVNDANFDEVVLPSVMPVLVDFGPNGVDRGFSRVAK